MNNIQRAIDKQAKLEAEAATGPWTVERNQETGDLDQVANGHHVNDRSVAAFYTVCETGDALWEENAILIAHLRNQAKLARKVIEAASGIYSIHGHVYGLYEVSNALIAWADHVNGITAAEDRPSSSRETP